MENKLNLRIKSDGEWRNVYWFDHGDSFLSFKWELLTLAERFAVLEAVFNDDLKTICDLWDELTVRW